MMVVFVHRNIANSYRAFIRLFIIGDIIDICYGYKTQIHFSVLVNGLMKALMSLLKVKLEEVD